MAMDGQRGCRGGKKNVLLGLLLLLLLQPLLQQLISYRKKECILSLLIN